MTRLPFSSKIRNRDEVVPLSMAPMKECMAVVVECTSVWREKGEEERERGGRKSEREKVERERWEQRESETEGGERHFCTSQLVRGRMDSESRERIPSSPAAPGPAMDGVNGANEVTSAGLVFHCSCSCSWSPLICPFRPLFSVHSVCLLLVPACCVVPQLIDSTCCTACFLALLTVSLLSLSTFLLTDRRPGESGALAADTTTSFLRSKLTNRYSTHTAH